MSTNVEAMFSNRVKPGHDLGTIVTEALNFQEVLRLAGF